MSSIGPIRCVTVSAVDLDAVEASYTQFLGYRRIGRTRVSADLARLWRAPDTAGADMLLLAPARGDDYFFRFVKAERPANFTPFSTHGWNAAELIVRDVDRLAEQLEHSPFRVIGAPQNLSFSDDIRAMQVLGHGDELLYLTEFKARLPGLDTPDARCDVDRTFIMILAGPSMDAMQSYYHRHFDVPTAAPVESRVKGMSAAFGNSPDHKYPIAALPLAGQSFIEVDQMPPQAAPRPAADGRLPDAIAMVSFVTTELPDRAHAIETPDAVYPPGSHAACMAGPAGELIELISLPAVG